MVGLQAQAHDLRVSLAASVIPPSFPRGARLELRRGFEISADDRDAVHDRGIGLNQAVYETVESGRKLSLMALAALMLQRRFV
jgi:hypothetical protein